MGGLEKDGTVQSAGSRGVKTLCMCQNVENFTPKRVNFTACKFLLFYIKSRYSGSFRSQKNHFPSEECHRILFF